MFVTGDTFPRWATAMTNPYLSLAPEALAGVWGMRAAELMPLENDADEQASASRDTALMLLAGAMRVVRDDIEPSFRNCDQDDRQQERVVRFEVLKRAASVAIPEHPDLWLRLWLLDAHARGMVDVPHALESDEGLCELLRHLGHITWVGGGWHPASKAPGATQCRLTGVA